MTVRRTSTRHSSGLHLDEPTLVQFVVLSMLLHILAIVLFGATGKGGAGRGEGLPETLDVTLRPIASESRSLGLARREGAPPAVPSSGRAAERTERPAAQPSSPVSIEPERFEIIAPPEITPSLEEPFVRPDTRVPEKIESPLPPARSVPRPPRIEAAPEQLERVAPATIQPQLTQPIETPRALRPVAPSVPLESLVPPVEPPLAKPLELPRQALPVAPAAPIERFAPRSAERELAAPVEPLAVKPLTPGTSIERTIAPPIERELAQPVEVPARPLPPSPAAPLERAVPPSTHELAPPGEPPAVRVPSRTSPEEPAAQPATSAPRPSVSAPSGAPPAGPALAPESLPSPRLVVPHPDEDIFKPREPTGFDLEAAKKRAVREMAREGSGSPGVLPFPLPIPETKSKEAKAMEKAIKPDCRTAYSGLGLLAVPALIAATITDEGCRW